MPSMSISHYHSAFKVGPLPIVLPLLRRLKLRDKVDAWVPVTDGSEVTHGQVMEALVLNAVISPGEMYTVEKWAQGLSASDTLGIEPEHLNDSCVSRTLDAVFPVLGQIQEAVLPSTVEGFQMDPLWVTWGMTEFVLQSEGCHEDAGPAFLFAGLATPGADDARPGQQCLPVRYVSAIDGGVPLWHRVLRNDAVEAAGMAEAMESLSKAAGPQGVTFLGGSELSDPDNLAEAMAAGICFVAREGREAFSERDYFEHRDRQGLKARGLSSLARCDDEGGAVEGVEPAGAPEEPGSGGSRSSGVCFGFETEVMKELNGMREPLRRLYVVSAAERRAARKKRKRQLQRLREGIQGVRANLGKRDYVTPDQIRRHAERLVAKTDLEGVIRCEISSEGQSDDERETVTNLELFFDGEAYRRKRQADGVFSLLTNLPAEFSGQWIARRFLGHVSAGNRFGAPKGPLGLRSVFLEDERRQVVLAFVMFMSAMAYRLLEHAVRTSLKASGSTIPRLYTGRPTQKPTARMMLEAFEFFTVFKDVDGSDIHYSTQPFNQLQTLIFEHLGVEDPWMFLQYDETLE